MVTYWAFFFFFVFLTLLLQHCSPEKPNKPFFQGKEAILKENLLFFGNLTPPQYQYLNSLKAVPLINWISFTPFLAHFHFCEQIQFYDYGVTQRSSKSKALWVVPLVGFPDAFFGLALLLKPTNIPQDQTRDPSHF